MDFNQIDELKERYRGETPWHSNWKAAFPDTLRERTFLNKDLGFHHRADVFTECGTAIEFQHSPISMDELVQREAFYPKLTWVLDGTMFKGFRLLKHLPDMNDPFLMDYEFAKGSNLALYRIAEITAKLPKPRKLTLSHPELFHLKPSAHFFSFTWRQPHRVWYAATAPLWIDLGGYFIYQLLHRQQLTANYSYLKVVPRKDFVAQYVKSF